MTFGARLEGVAYTERPAAYAVVAGENSTVAAVRGTAGMIGLPGGGSLPGETPEQTLVREVREELARSVRLVRRIGEATQFFYAADDDCGHEDLASRRRFPSGTVLKTVLLAGVSDARVVFRSHDPGRATELPVPVAWASSGLIPPRSPSHWIT